MEKQRMKQSKIEEVVGNLEIESKQREKFFNAGYCEAAVYIAIGAITGALAVISGLCLYDWYVRKSLAGLGAF